MCILYMYINIHIYVFIDTYIYIFLCIFWWLIYIFSNSCYTIFSQQLYTSFNNDLSYNVTSIFYPALNILFLILKINPTNIFLETLQHSQILCFQITQSSQTDRTQSIYSNPTLFLEQLFFHYIHTTEIYNLSA